MLFEKISHILQIQDIDTVNFKAPITLQMKTLQEGRKTYEKDTIEVCNFVKYVLNVYPDKKYYIDRFQRDVFESIMEEVKQ